MGSEARSATSSDPTHMQHLSQISRSTHSIAQSSFYRREDKDMHNKVIYETSSMQARDR